MAGWLAALPALLSALKPQGGAPLKAPQVGGGVNTPQLQAPQQSGFSRLLGQGAQACMSMNPPAWCGMGGNTGSLPTGGALGASDLAGSTGALA